MSLVMERLVPSAEPPAAGTERRDPIRWGVPALCALAVVLYALFVRPVDPVELGSFGLIAALHPMVPAALALLSVAFVLELRTPRPRSWLLAGACLLVVVGGYGLPSLVEPVARLPVAWLHAGWTEYVNSHGDVLHGFDARFSWPAFFALAAWVSEAAGLPDATPLLAWTPPVLTGLAAVGVHAVASAVLGRDRRAPWLAVWLFLGVNWIEQDYFSPQGLVFLIYVGALAVALRYLCRPSLLEPSVRPGRLDRISPGSRGAAGCVLVLLICGLAPAHQVTPFALAGALLALTAFGRLRRAWPLALLALLAPLTWLVLGASDYWIGHLHVLINGVGDLSSSVQENVGNRVSGDAGRMTVLGLRFGLVGLIVTLAVAGWWGLRSERGRSLPLAVVTLAPFGLIALQSYGGEMLLRGYLYALPLLCTLGAAALQRWLRPAPESRRNPAVIAAALAGVLGVMSAALVASRGGNDGYVAFREEDVAVVAEAYQLANSGQRINSLTAYAPLNWSRVGEVRQGSLERLCRPGPYEAFCVRKLAPDFVVVTPAQEAYGVSLLGLPPGWTQRVVSELIESRVYQEKLRIDDTVLLARVPKPKGVR